MKKTILMALAALLLASLTTPLFAATANFQCNCSSSLPTSCVCDARRPLNDPTTCGAATPTLYFWDWGDGTSTSGSTAYFVSHSYPAGTFLNICLAVFCSDGTSDTQCHCFTNNIGIGTCVRPNNGQWTP